MSIFNFTGFQSPPKRPLVLPSPTSPFCTSPSQLQEVTLDQDASFSHSLGVRSPGGPMRGRSVKEFEEQLTNLKKENFNLKLRIYFLEERMGTNFNLDKENVVKKNVELMVEVESLRKEVEEKHELLCQAVKAMELEDEEHKKVAAEKDAVLAECRNEIENLKSHLLDAKTDSELLSHRSYHSVATDLSSQMFKFSDNGAEMKELQEKVQSLEEELNQEKENFAAVQLVLDQKDIRIRNLTTQLEDADHKLMLREEEVKDLVLKLDENRTKHQALLRKHQEKSQNFDRVCMENQQLREKYIAIKEELEKEHLRYEKMKMSSDQKIMELQTKLEASLTELKKSQDLVVSSKLLDDPSANNTDDRSFSVSQSATPVGSAQKDALAVPAHLPAVLPAPSSPDSATVPSSPSQQQSITTTTATPTDNDGVCSPPRPSTPSPHPANNHSPSSSNASSPSAIMSFNEELIQSLETVVKLGGDATPLIEKLKQEREVIQQKIVKLKADQMKACKIIKSMIDSRNKTNKEIAALKQRNEDLENELECAVSKYQQQTKEGAADATAQIHDQNHSNSSDKENINMSGVGRFDDSETMDEQSRELLDHYKILTNQLEEKNQILVATLKEKNNHLEKIQKQYEEILKSLKRKEDHMVDLEFELLSSNQERHPHGNHNNSVGSNDIEFYLKQIQDKDVEIAELKNKLTRRTGELQGLVNNELWEKNRQIEKMQKRQVSQEDVVKLQKEIASRDLQLKIIKDRIADLGIDIDLQLDDSKATGDSQIGRLQSELEKSEKLRQEANEVCAILSRRLQELAVFLDSLLRQKSVLGFLGGKENKRLRQIIDQSLDLSRSFTMSMMVNPEQSLMQLTNITCLLSTSLADDSLVVVGNNNDSLMYESHLSKVDDSCSNVDSNSQIIETLRQQIVNLKYELQLRDVELSKLTCLEDKMTNTSLVEAANNAKHPRSDNQSESEAWSEPDRSVSKARIGLADDSIKSPVSKKSPANLSSDSASEPGIKLSRTPSKRSMLLNESRQAIMEMHKQVTDLEEKLNERDTVNSKLMQELETIDAKLQETAARLAEAETEKLEAESKIQVLQKQIDEIEAVDNQLRDKVTQLTNRLDELEKYKSSSENEFRNEIKKLSLEKDKALSVAKEAEEVAEVAKNELKAAEVEMKSMKSEHQRHLTDQVRNVEAHYTKKIEELQTIAINEVQSLQKTIKQIRTECTSNHVKKREVEAANDMIAQLTTQVSETENAITKLSNENAALREQLAEARDNIKNLKRDLDNATLQYSEVVLEKTDVANEKARIEQQLNEELARYAELKRHLDEKESEVNILNQGNQRQISTLQQQKSRLQVRISELESMNAELRNRLIKAQSGGNGASDHNVMLSMSLPSTMHNYAGSYRRQTSDNSAGYMSSEDPHHVHHHTHAGPGSGQFRLAHNVTAPAILLDMDRHEANSSPDLGIESDHGRFSSLETQMTTNTVSRPLLQTLELTESMNNLLDAEKSHVHSPSCDNEHACCQRTLEISHENTDLKRKLLRTRRALEETVNQLALANQRKKQVEKTICKQIHKTSQVLRKAKANLDSGSETDVYKK